MDPLRIAFRGLAAYVILLVLMRISGKRTIGQGTPFDFLLALILGDLIDDAVWSEVPLSQFVVAASTVVLAKLTTLVHRANPLRELGVVACATIAIAGVAATIAAGDRTTVVPGPDRVAEQLTRQVVAHRPAQTVPLLSKAGRLAYPPPTLSQWGHTLERAAGPITDIQGMDATIDGDRASAVVIVAGTRGTLEVPVALRREYGTWKVERLAQPQASRH